VQEQHAKAGSIIVMNPKTGEIYALANRPIFDLNKFSKAEVESLRNRAVTDTYEPGSTFKAIVASAAVDEGIFAPSSWFHLPSTIKIADRVIGEAHARPAKDFTLTDIVKFSSNVGAATVGLKLGKEMLYKYIVAFGLTEKTGIDFPGEVKGYVLKPEEWYGSTIATVPFGQGISVTPLQLTRAYAAIANDGVMVKPYLVSKVVSPQGRTIMLANPESGNQAISPETAREVRYMLEKVITEGTGTSAQIPGYRIAGKTGTAQKPRENGRGYDPGRYVSSFIGFAPAQDPEVIVSVIIDEPQDTIWGGAVAAPVFKNVTEFSLHHLKIQP
jgi:cell division protein FtsI/penicillin-binding protein 2